MRFVPCHGRYAVLLMSVLAIGFTPNAPLMAQVATPSADLFPAATVQYGDTASNTTDMAGRLISAAPTHPQISLTPDKTEILRLDQDPGTIIVGNPNQLAVILESKRSLLLVPRQPGATFLRILDQDGNVLMQRHVAIVAPAKNYVRIRRTCNETSGNGCQPTSVYYCPDTCHTVDLVNTPNMSGSGMGMSVTEVPNINEESIVETPTDSNIDDVYDDADSDDYTDGDE